ncbi:efflux transporter, outer membrane factor (OMF) lipoprotein, NodT family [Chitinophaga terrae (ex Kim and Jung 2007)]|uniref:Efflux transporter, outer membrane factor (OMF) lipoprotein, NodT family n=1 Tax=Chitinophaga terrae (ex Kim and Jung 2007) TaxID=408074 RepID=A0A1H4BAL7_9BACT|nr:efflux transporter outer membrane subunit [Chitinophaga terrae (ex Kim and Jung 2007)]MDQ0106249.1 NodT family efflux transporter outer membrane factor (OMF) lipoprotein [Chitinophaga terrae (ex Kim and Jung 2007)]SEA45245.1 efflux transporter, outer membrane factor (OMF) lipoprotein, NodT family [Chitinophaga terrae (ex Kim and Jung 2007)]
MRLNKQLHIAILLIAAGSWFSCNVMKPYTPPGITQSNLYRDAGTSDTNTIATLHWREIFTDTLLQQLIEAGIKNNLDLQVAYSRMRQADASYRQSRLALFPAVNADASATFAGASNTVNTQRNITSQVYTAEVTANWEADIWGKLRSSKRANLAAFLQAGANARAVQTALVAEIANNYYLLLSLDEKLKITQQTVVNREATVEVMKALKIADVVTGAAVVQSEASRYAAEVTIPDLKQSIRETENQLCILLGVPSGPIARDSLNDQLPIMLLKTGVPMQLLANRPDIQEAEYNLRYYFQLANVARAQFYPSLNISASGGYSAYRSFTGPGSFVSNLVAGLTQPIFNQGINKARLKIAREQQQQAALGFQSAVLTAGQEVSNALFSYQTAMDKSNTRRLQLLNLQKSVEYTQELVRYGFANYTEVLNAQQSLLQAQLQQINDHLQRLQSIVYLYRALGGGWQ